MNTDTKLSVEQGNKIIAEFMGYTYHQHPDAYALPGWKFPNRMMHEKVMSIGAIGVRPYLCRTGKEIEFYSSWDWLMPVVEKIESLGFRVYIEKGAGVINYCKIKSRGKIVGECDTYSNKSKLQPVWLAVVEFIKWYNEQNK